MNNFKDSFNQKYKANNSPFGNEAMPIIKKMVELTEPCDVLDLGVGDGRNALYLLENGYNVTGIDMSSEALRLLSEKSVEYENQITLIKSNVLDFENEKEFGAIIGIGLLHFLELSDIKTLISRVQSWTKVGGVNVFAARMTQNLMNNLPHILEPDELKGFYEKEDWEIVVYKEKNMPDRNIAIIIAKKIK